MIGLWRKTSRELAGLAALASICASSPAYAQRIEAQPEGLLDFVATMDVQHEGNIAHISPEAARERGTEPSDQRYSPKVELQVEKPIGRHYAKVAAHIAYDFHGINTHLDRERLGADAEVGLNLARCQIRTAGSYRRRQGSLRDADEGFQVIDDGVGPIDNAETRLKGDASLTCGGMIGLRPFVNASAASARNSAPEVQISNNAYVTFGGGLGYHHPSIGTAQLYASKSIYRYENQFLSDGSERGFDITRYGLHLERDVGSRFRVTGDISIPHVDTREPDVGATDGLNWLLDVTFRPTERMTLSTAMVREVSTSLLTDSLYNRNSEINAALSYALSSRTLLRFGMQLQDQLYYGGQGIYAPELQEGRFEIYQISAAHQLNRRMRLIGLLAHEDRDATGTYYDYESFRGLMRIEFRH